ncbi:MAG: serine/threonine-protein kinase [Gammaproteobacteria bacterium]|nr:serine/threonine-protein kinase [Gammaproteobacteria bacterium]
MSVIKGYKIQSLLAKGGMATIYIAMQESLKRQVALKILDPKLDTNILEHFLDESRIIASLKHPNIIPVFDVGRVGIHFYHAMEYLEGGDLEAKIKNGLDVHTALEIVLELADALYLVHNNGVIHGDIKPANVVFRNDDSPVLTDFGISRRTNTDGNANKKPDEVLASPSYASPELMQGLAFDFRTDIYSLGVMLYEMLVGEKPYTGATKVEMVANSIQQPIPALPDSLTSLQPLIDHMLAKQADERIADARIISRYIKKYLRDHPNINKSQQEQDPANQSHLNTDVVVEYVPKAQNHITINPSKTLMPALIALFSAIVAMAIWHFVI